MSAKPKKAAAKGKRYTDTEKQEIVSYVNDFNAKNGRGGQASAVKKFGVTALTITGWLKTVKTAKPAAPAKVVAKAPAKAAPAKAPAAAKPAPVKRAKRAKVPQGTRYTEEQKKAVLDFVAQVNAKKGRGGMTAAAKKFKVTPLTVSNWIAKSGGVTTGAPKANAKEAKAAAKAAAKALVKLARAEKIIAQVRSLLNAK
jgi:transposase